MWTLVVVLTGSFCCLKGQLVVSDRQLEVATCNWVVQPGVNTPALALTTLILTQGHWKQTREGGRHNFFVVLTGKVVQYMLVPKAQRALLL